MNKHRPLMFTHLFVLIAVSLFWGVNKSIAQSETAVPPYQRDATAVIERRQNRVTQADRQAAADHLAALRAAAVPKAKTSKGTLKLAGAGGITTTSSSMPMDSPGGTPDYFGGITPNWAYSPLLRKFVDTLPGLRYANRNNLQQYIPVAVADINTYPGSDYYEIALVQYTEQMHTDLPATTLRGYVQVATSVIAGAIALTYPNGNPILDINGNPVFAVDNPHYMGPLIIAQRDRPVRVKYTNYLPTGDAGKLFIPVDTTVMGAGMGPLMMDTTPTWPMNYTENRTVIHLHGGKTPWISDGTPHQWITPAGELTDYKVGASKQNVPDMPDPCDGSVTLYYTNQQSARLMFYHDHVYGITRLNVYVGEAAPYIIADPTEQDLINAGIIPAEQIPLVIQDRTFVDANTINTTDPTWNWGSMPGMAMAGDLWFPHVYMPNQNPNTSDGINPMGRWDYGPWFWPPWPATIGPITNPDGTVAPGYPDVSMVMEALMDTPIVNGTAYPTLTVQPRAYRFRILNAADDRFFNLLLVEADPCVITSDSRTNTEVNMVPFNPGTWPAGWPTPDSRDGGVPNPAMLGPDIIQIGNECGFLAAPAVWTNIPIGYDRDTRSITVGNIKEHNLFLGCAERADIIVDFSAFAGKTLILYNDSSAPVPATDPRLDYYTGDSNYTETGGTTTTLPGYGPNIRTIMQIQVANTTPAAAFDINALNAAFASTATTQGVFEKSQDPILVPQTGYDSAYNATFPSDKTAYVRIQDVNLTFTPMDALTPMTIQFRPKAIAEEFENSYGRMQGYLGVEVPFTNGQNQTTIWYDYMDPATETIQDSITPMAPVADDGTQIWKITHNGVDTHPVHFHFFDVQLINRVDWAGVVKPPEKNELGWKETVRMNPLEDCIVAMRPTAPKMPFTVPDSNRMLDPTMPLHDSTIFKNVDPCGNPITVTNEFTNFGWEYMWHCHILSHEEMDMMRPIVFQAGATSTYVTPESPTIGTAVAGDAQADVDFTAPVSTGGSPIVSYTATSNPGDITATGASNPITVTGLANGTAYTFTVTATNTAGTGPASAPSNSVTPAGAATVPGAPTMMAASAGVAQAMVYFVAPVSDGGSPITSYTATSSPGGITGTGTSSPVTITGLTNGTAYTFTVTATNTAGTGLASAASNSVTPTAKVPGAPTIGTATAGDTQATVTFTAPASDGGSTITSYTATSSPGGLTGTGTASPITVTGLTNGTAYTFTVTATNAIGTGPASASSNSVTPAVVPGAPTIGTATAGNAQANVLFTAPASDGGSPITSYTATSSPGGLTGTGTQSPLTVIGLTNGTIYTFTVTATNAIGTGPASVASNSVTPTGPAAVPGAPTIGTATAGNAQATVSFSPPASSGGSAITSYMAISSSGGITATGTSSPITVTGLANGTAYTFTVRATNSVGTGLASGASNSVTPVSPATAPGAPTIGTATAGIAQATVSFTAPASDGCSVITSYTATSNPGGITATGASSPITVTGLTNNTTYTFTVTATNAIGTGPASAPSNSVMITTVAPAAPSKLVATGSVASSNPPTVSLSWTDNSNNEAGFLVERATNSKFTTGLTTFTVGANVTTYTDTTVLAKTKYYYRIEAINAIGDSAYSNVKKLTTADQLPSAPSDLAISDVTNKSATLTWTDNATNETGFVIEYATNAAFTTGRKSKTVKTPNLTTYTRTGLKPNTTYYFHVAAKNKAGNSEFSNVVSGSTLP